MTPTVFRIEFEYIVGDCYMTFVTLETIKDDYLKVSDEIILYLN